MVQIVLVRPGTTEFDEQKRIQGTLDIPLSERGQAEVKRIVEELADRDIDTVYTCPCQAARQTAQALADALGIKAKPLDKLQNVNHGLWQGKRLDEVKQTQPKVFRQWQERPESVCPPSGESLLDAQDRIVAAVTRLLKKHKEGVIALVVPEPVASLVRCHLVRGQLGDLWKTTSEGGRWEMITVEPQRLVHSR